MSPQYSYHPRVPNCFYLVDIMGFCKLVKPKKQTVQHIRNFTWLKLRLNGSETHNVCNGQGISRKVVLDGLTPQQHRLIIARTYLRKIWSHNHGFQVQVDDHRATLPQCVSETS